MGAAVRDAGDHSITFGYQVLDNPLLIGKGDGKVAGHQPPELLVGHQIVEGGLIIPAQGLEKAKGDGLVSSVDICDLS